MAVGCWKAGFLGVVLALGISSFTQRVAAYGYDGIGPDDFPVFDDPKMLTVAEADARVAVLPRDAVIGVVVGGEARAYPIVIMGIHELGNDRIAGIPIAITW